MTLAKLFLIFFIYAVIGWFTEVLYVWALSKKYVNTLLEELEKVKNNLKKAEKIEENVVSNVNNENIN